jgi:copper chaperone
MAQEVLSVPEVSCQHCINALEGAVGALDGVGSVKVDLDRKDITIDYDAGRVSHDRFVAAITGEGYQVGEAAPG